MPYFTSSFIDTYNENCIKIWGISKTFFRDKITIYEIDEYNNLSNYYIDSIGLKGGFYNLEGKYDNNCNMVLTGINDYSKLFIIKIDQDYNLIKGW